MAQGKRWPDEVRSQFEGLLLEGFTIRGGAAELGVSVRSGASWAALMGGVNPKWKAAAITRCENGFRLGYFERAHIEAGIKHRVSVREIARRLERSASAISREISRNGGRDGYKATRAELRARDRAARPRAGLLDPDHNPRLHAAVADRLWDGQSPEQISGELALQFSDDESMQVSHETIYRGVYASLFVQSRGIVRDELKAALRSNRTARKSAAKTAAGDNRGKLRDMVPISQRPPSVDDRAVPGHWEIDLIVGKGSRSAIGVLVERCTRFVILLHMGNDKTAQHLANQMIAEVKHLPEHLRQSLTCDQGKEMAEHARITFETEMKVYFCDPHSPWQKGSVENMNWLLRADYFPKGEDLSVHTQETLDRVAAQLNRRPRKTLAFATPASRMNQLLSQAA